MRNAQQRYELEALSVISCIARFWYRDNSGQSPYCGDCLVGHVGCEKFLKLYKTFGAAVLQNISGGILSGLWALPHLISSIGETNMVDERGMDNRPPALVNRFSPFFHADRVVC